MMRVPNQARPVARMQNWGAMPMRAGILPACGTFQGIKCGAELVGELAGLATCPEDVPGCIAALVGIYPFIQDCEDCLGSSLLTPVCGIVETLLNAGVDVNSSVPGLTAVCQGYGGCCS